MAAVTGANAYLDDSNEIIRILLNDTNITLQLLNVRATLVF